MNIFKEYTANQKRVKDQIKREKEADKEKHDRMMDQARTRDTRRKNSMTESEIHVRLDHLDGDSRQKKAGAVMRKHERAGHIEYVGNTDKGVVFKAKSKSHADRLHKELKPHATGVEHMSEAKSAQDPDIKDRKGTQPAAYHKGLKKTTKAKRDAHFKKHGKKADDDASAYKDAPGDKKARKGDMPKSKYTKFVDNMMKEGTDFAAHRAAKATAPSDSDRKKMAKVADLLRKEREKKAAMKKEEFEQFDEAIKKTPLGPKGKAAQAHITALGKKHGRSFGDQRLHIYHYPNKYDKKTNAHAKVLDQHQFGNKTEETVDEGAYKGKDAFGRGVTAALRGGKAGAYMSRKAKERSDMNKKNDQGAAKKGYALSVTDKDKAMKKARRKGLSPKHPTTNYNRKLPEGTDEALDSFGKTERSVARGSEKTSSLERRMQKRQRKHEKGLAEKTLTPAEKKKREDVAKAIERDNPNMPMDKKMAIATATAKRVAEAKITDRTRAIMERALNKKDK